MDLIDSLVEVKLPNEESFLKVKETLTRIGVASKKDKKLYHVCGVFAVEEQSVCDAIQGISQLGPVQACPSEFVVDCNSIVFDTSVISVHDNVCVGAGLDVRNQLDIA